MNLFYVIVKFSYRDLNFDEIINNKWSLGWKNKSFKTNFYKIENSYILSTDNYYKTGIISKFLSRVIKVYFDRKISFNYRLFIKDFEYIIKNEKINHEYSYDFKNKKIKKFLHKRKY